MKILRLTVLLILAAAALAAAAQRPRLYTSDDVLSSGLVNDIVQDSAGFVWIATEHGLNRYDGTRFKTYYHEPGNGRSLPGNYVHALCAGSDGEVLVGCINGLMIYNPATDSFADIPLIYKGARVDTHVTHIARLSTGEIWVATDGCGLFRLRESEGKLAGESLDKLNALVESEFVSVVFEDTSHTMWIGTSTEGLCRYYPGMEQVRRYGTPEIGGNVVTSAALDGSGSIIIGTLDGGVARYDRHTESFRVLAYADGHRPAVKTLSTVNGTVYAGTDGEGVCRVEDSGLRRAWPGYTPGDDLDFAKVHKILHDRDGNVWYGLFQKGVSVSPRRRFNFNNIGKSAHGANRIGEECVTAVFADTDRSLWVSCDNGGIYHLDPWGEPLGHTPMKGTGMCFVRDSRGVLWCGTYPSGAYVLDGGRWKPVPGLSDRKIRAIAESPDGKMYIGTLDRGLECYDPLAATVTQCLTRETLGSVDPWETVHSINALYFSRDGRLWLAHYNGVSCYDPSAGKIVKINGHNNVEAFCVGFAVAEGADGTMWFGTSAGLFGYDPREGARTAHYSSADGLASEVVCGLSEDPQGYLWMSSYHGISRLNPKDSEIVNYDAGDGVQANEFYYGAFCRDDRGVLYFGGTNGVTSFNPLDIPAPAPTPVPVITEVGVYASDGESNGTYEVVAANCRSGQEITLAPDKNTIRIFYSTLTYANPGKFVFEYRLREHSDNWVSTEPGQNLITFYNLSPGTYNFELRPHGNPDKVTSLRIRVEAPWYLSGWAKCVYGLMIVTVLGIFLNLWRQRVKAGLELANRRHSEEVAQAKLRLFTSFSHEIRTPLTLIIDPLRKLIDRCRDESLLPTYTVIYRNASRIMGLVNQLMDLRKFDNGQMRLRARETDLVGFVEDVMKPFEGYAREHGIAFSFHHPESRLSAWIDLELFDKVLMNILSNAFKFTKAGAIDINLEVGGDGMIEMRISDTGSGIPEAQLTRVFDRFYQGANAASSPSPGTGIGLHLVKQIVELHHGTVAARNRADVTGAEFCVRIPAGCGHLTEDEKLSATAPAPLKASGQPVQSLRIDWDALGSAGKSDKGREVIVVVEDDEEIRRYLCHELSGGYRNVVSFAGAEEAYRAILTMQPAPGLVISDVMMEGMDGVTLTRKIKQNANTNHTPVILLSARSDAQSIKEAIDAGADQYMTKPFDSDILLSTVANLINSRHVLKMKFNGSQAQADKVEDLQLKSADEQLMRRVMDAINRNLSSSEFSVERLAEEVGLSRAHLHRKLKELTNLSSRDFIKSIRMRQAARLLTESHLSVAETAYAVGFANASHFSIVFKDFYGMTPTQYTGERKVEEEAEQG